MSVTILKDTKYLTRLAHDYIFFTQEVWKHTGLFRVAKLGMPELDILDFIANGPPRRGVLGPRGRGKTTWGTAMYTAYRLYVDPDQKIIVPSKGGEAAVKMMKLTRDWIRIVPFLQHLAPPKNIPGERIWRDNTTMFDAGPSRPSKDPSIFALGIEGQLENCRAHIIIADDVETRENTQTLAARKELAKRVDEFTSVATFGKRETLFFGTYHHEESLYLKEAEKGVTFRTWPLLYPEPTDRILNLAPLLQERLDKKINKPGDIVFEAVDRQYVIERQARGKTYFAMQQMLIANLSDADRYPLQLSDLIVFPVSPDKAPLTIAWGTRNDRGGSTRIEEIPSHGFGNDGFYAPIMYDNIWQEYRGTRMWVDPSGRGEDHTAYAIVSHLNGYLWVKDIGSFQGGYDDQTLHGIALAARQNRVDSIFVEENFGGGQMAKLLQSVLRNYLVQPASPTDQAGNEHGMDFPKGWQCHVEAVNIPGRAGYKENRIIDALEPVCSRHRLIIHPKIASFDPDPNNNSFSFQYQFTRITRQRNCLEHDDIIEALAMAVAMWDNVLEQDPKKSAADARDKLLELELERMRTPSKRNPSSSIHITQNRKRWFQHQTESV